MSLKTVINITPAIGTDGNISKPTHIAANWALTQQAKFENLHVEAEKKVTRHRMMLGGMLGGLYVAATAAVMYLPSIESKVRSIVSTVKSKFGAASHE